MKDELPAFVTFTSGAKLLMDLGLVETITADGLRYHDRNKSKWWRFGDEPGQIPYVMVGNARTMETGTFLEMFKQGPRRGGLGNKPKQEAPDNAR